MSEQAKSKPSDVMKAAAERTPNSIPVAMLRLSEREPADIPGRGGQASVTATPREQVIDAAGKRIGNTRCWVIDFIPAIRHHRVVYFADNPAEEPIVRMIWEGHVKHWEPLAG